MSSNINFSGSIQRFLKGDADPINLFGFNPSRAEMRANTADRSRRASQIAAEQNSEGLRAAGGSIDPATKQVKKLKSKTHFKALSPFNPVPLPSVTISAAAAEAAKNEKQRKKSKRQLAAKNRTHEDTALLAKNLNKPKDSESTRFSKDRLRRSILGGAA
jgi:hypothetical protein